MRLGPQQRSRSRGTHGSSQLLLQDMNSLTSLPSTWQPVSQSPLAILHFQIAWMTMKNRSAMYLCGWYYATTGILFLADQLSKMIRGIFEDSFNTQGKRYMSDSRVGSLVRKDYFERVNHGLRITLKILESILMERLTTKPTTTTPMAVT